MLMKKKKQPSSWPLTLWLFLITRAVVICFRKKLGLRRMRSRPTSKPTKHKYLMTQKIIWRSCLSGTLKHATLPSHLRVKRREERQFVPESNKV